MWYVQLYTHITAVVTCMLIFSYNKIYLLYLINTSFLLVNYIEGTSAVI